MSDNFYYYFLWNYHWRRGDLNIVIFPQGCRLTQIVVCKTLYMIRVSVIFLIVPMLWAVSESRVSLLLPHVTDSKMVTLKFYEILFLVLQSSGRVRCVIWRPAHPSQPSEYDFCVHLKSLSYCTRPRWNCQLSNLAPSNKGLYFESIHLRRMTKVFKSVASSQELSVRSHQPEDYLTTILASPALFSLK